MSSQLNAPSSPMPQAFEGAPPDLPRDYGVTRLVLMPRDPQWMHAYWEVAAYTWDEVERNFGREARSTGRPILRLYAENNGLKKTFDVGVDLAARNWYINSPARGGSWRAELGLLLADGRFVLLAVSNTIQLPMGQVSENVDEKWGMLKAEWEKLFALSGSAKLGGGSLDMARILAQRWELLRQVSSWPSSPGGASWGKVPERHKGFWLVAECELVVWGATEPDAQLRIQGRPVALNPDGTFSLRFALPDGRLSIPIEAVNRDGDMSKAVQFTVDRATQKSGD